MNNEIDNCCGTTADKQKMQAEIADLKTKLENSILAKATVDKVNLNMSKAHNDVVEENNELKAQVGLLRDTGEKANRKLWNAYRDHALGERALTVCHPWISAVAKTQQQCLADIQDDAVEKFKKKLLKRSSSDDETYSDYLNYLLNNTKQ